jgi:hypothetical protein
MTAATQVPVAMVALNTDVVDYSRLLTDKLQTITTTTGEYRQLVTAKAGAGCLAC